MQKYTWYRTVCMHVRCSEYHFHMNSKWYYFILSTESLLLAAEIITTLGKVKKVSGLPIRAFHIVIRKKIKKILVSLGINAAAWNNTNSALWSIKWIPYYLQIFCNSFPLKSDVQPERNLWSIILSSIVADRALCQPTQLIILHSVCSLS